MWFIYKHKYIIRGLVCMGDMSSHYIVRSLVCMDDIIIGIYLPIYQSFSAVFINKQQQLFTLQKK